MPLVALNKQTNERICILEHPEPRMTIRKEGLVCPYCHEPFLIVAGVQKQNHFRHKSVCTFTEYEAHPESEEHLYAKSIVRNALKEKYIGTKVEIDLEVPIPEAKRIADIMISYPMGWRRAYEIQLSPITPFNLEKRINDYRNAGVDVIWYFGKHAATASSAAICSKLQTEYSFIDFRYS